MNTTLRKAFITACVGALITLTLFTGPACRKEAPPPMDTHRPPPNLRKYLGTYRIDPSYDTARLVLREDGSVSFAAGDVTNLIGTYTIDERILRIFLTLPGSPERRPMGVFLLSRFDKAGWPGLWDGETRNLLRIRDK